MPNIGSVYKSGSKRNSFRNKRLQFKQFNKYSLTHIVTNILDTVGLLISSEPLSHSVSIEFLQYCFVPGTQLRKL